MATSYHRGHKTTFEGSAWIYCDTGTPVDDERPCVKCGQKPIDGMDACTGHVPGAKSVCCGHGATEPILILTAKARARLEWHAEHMKRLLGWPEEWRKEWEERAAIMEHHGGKNTIDAESSAFLQVLELRRRDRECDSTK